MTSPRWAPLGALLAGFCLTGCPPKTASVAPSSQADTLPAADEVLARSLQATGGIDAILAHETRVTTATVSVPVQGLTMQVEIRQQAPGSMETITDVTGLGQSRQGTDGETVWSIDTISGPRVLQGAEAAGVLRRARYDLLVDLDRWYPTRETVGQEDFAGEPCWKLRLVDNDGAEELHWYAQGSGLLRGQEATVVSDMGALTVRSSFSEYRAFDGVTMATRLVQELGPMQLITQIESVRANVPGFTDIVVPPEVTSLQQ